MKSRALPGSINLDAEQENIFRSSQWSILKVAQAKRRQLHISRSLLCFVATVFLRLTLILRQVFQSFMVFSQRSRSVQIRRFTVRFVMPTLVRSQKLSGRPTSPVLT